MPDAPGRDPRRGVGVRPERRPCADGLAEAAREAGWSFRFTEDLRGGRLPSAVETAAFRILQEALANAARHADSHRLDVVLGRRAEWLYLEVRDDGVGFAPVVDAATGRGLGLGFAR
jgi:signal transduction histidine kinase